MSIQIIIRIFIKIIIRISIEIDIIISRDRRILEIAVEEMITYFSTCSSAEAAIEAIKSEGESNCVEAVGDRKKIQSQWGLD